MKKLQNGRTDGYFSLYILHFLFILHFELIFDRITAMPTYKTHQLIDNLEKQTQLFLSKAASEWQVTSAEILLQQPEANKWSAAQCLEHLNSYGHYYLPEIEKAIDSAKRKGLEAIDEFKTGLLGNYFTQLMLPKEGKIRKMRAPQNHHPTAHLDAHKVVAEFIDQQERILKLLEKARRVNLEETRVPISIAKFIKLKLGDVFMFLIAHNYRHIIQAEKTLGKDVDLIFASPPIA